MRRAQLFAVTTIALAPLSACVTSAPGAADEGLTATERAGVDAALEAARALTVASNSIQGVSSMPPDESLTGRALDMPALGSCPTVSLESAKTSSTSLQMTLDFGDGCSPFETDYVVSGAAVGTLSPTDGSLSVTFEDLQAGDGSLDGTASVTYGAETGGVTLTGAWNLETDAAATAGDGTVAYDRTAGTTTIRDFNGTASSDGSAWMLTTASLSISPTTFESFIPFAGTLTIDGEDARPVSVTFDENSPSTGLVSVQVGNLPAQQMSLFQL